MELIFLLKLKIKMLILINNACYIETMRLLDFTNFRFAFSGQLGIGSAARVGYIQV